MIVSGEDTPSILCDGCKYEVKYAGEEIESMDDVMSSTSETTNLGAICHSGQLERRHRRMTVGTYRRCTAIKVV